jgi:hypothetical protein
MVTRDPLNMALREIRLVGLDWSHLAQEKDLWSDAKLVFTRNDPEIITISQAIWLSMKTTEPTEFVIFV